MSRAAIPAPTRPTRRSSQRKRTTRAKFTAFGMVKRAGRSVSNDPGLQDLLRASADAICFVGQELGFPRAARARLHQRGKPRIDRAVRRGGASRPAREALLDCEHFFDGYKANPRLRARLRRGGARAGRALGGALRHQWRHASRRGGGDRRGGRRGRLSRRAARHPRAQRHRTGGRQLACGGRAPACGRSRAR